MPAEAGILQVSVDAQRRRRASANPPSPSSATPPGAGMIVKLLVPLIESDALITKENAALMLDTFPTIGALLLPLSLLLVPSPGDENEGRWSEYSVPAGPRPL